MNANNYHFNVYLFIERVANSQHRAILVAEHGCSCCPALHHRHLAALHSDPPPTQRPARPSQAEDFLVWPFCVIWVGFFSPSTPTKHGSATCLSECIEIFLCVQSGSFEGIVSALTPQRISLSMFHWCHWLNCCCICAYRKVCWLLFVRTPSKDILLYYCSIIGWIAAAYVLTEKCAASVPTCRRKIFYCITAIQLV